MFIGARYKHVRINITETHVVPRAYDPVTIGTLRLVGCVPSGHGRRTVFVASSTITAMDRLTMWVVGSCGDIRTMDKLMMNPKKAKEGRGAERVMQANAITRIGIFTSTGLVIVCGITAVYSCRKPSNIGLNSRRPVLSREVLILYRSLQLCQ